MTRLRFITIAFAILTVITFAFAQTQRPYRINDRQVDHVAMTADELKWRPAPPSLPPGAELAVVSGDPSKAGLPFTMRVKFPDGYKVPPHWHPTDENVTVIQGTINLGMGDKFDQSATKAFPVGAFALMPNNMRHYAWAGGETIVQIHGIGPFAITYVNPADDPRKKPK